MDLKNDKAVKELLNDTQEDLLAVTLPMRKSYFEQVLKECIECTFVQQKDEMNVNLSNLVMSVIGKEFNERQIFLQVFAQQLGRLIEVFVQTFTLRQNNKLGNMFLVFLEIVLKDNDPLAKAINFPAPKLFAFAEQYVKVLSNYRISMMRQSTIQMKTSTFQLEVGQMNTKTYKVLEALIMILKFYIDKIELQPKVFMDDDLKSLAFELFIKHPYNNVLHNQLRRYLVAVIETRRDDMIDMYFLDNQSFQIFLRQVLQKRKLTVRASLQIRVGYIGQLVLVINELLKNDRAALGLNSCELTRQRMEGSREHVLQGRV